MTERVGFGTDLHRLVPGDGIPLGGVLVPCPFAPVARSDGDVLLHAVVDALLGAMGRGDIGERYPESKVARGESSRRFVLEVMHLLRERGGAVVNLDCVVDLERPKLGPHKDAIRASVAALLGVSPERVNVKAKTAEGMGPVGEGKAVAAQAAVLVEFGESPNG